MALIVWSGADPGVITKVIGAVVTRLPVAHSVINLKQYEKIPALQAGDVLLACGTRALELLVAAGLAPKGRTVTSLREKPIKYMGGIILLTFDPGSVHRDYGRLPDIQWDTALAIRLHKTGTLKPKVGEYRFVTDFDDLIIRVHAKYEETGVPVEVACDLETLGLVEYDPTAWIISIAFTVDDGKSDLMYFSKGEVPEGRNNFTQPPWEEPEVTVYSQIEWLLTTDMVSLRGANFKFDSRWLQEKWGLRCTNFKFDTVMVGSLLDENRSNSLKLHAKVMTGMGGYDSCLGDFDMGRMDLVPKPILLQYAGGDTDVTLQVSKVEKVELRKDPLLTNFYVKLMHPASRVFDKLERVGVLVDQPYYKVLQQELEVEISRLHTEMLELVPRKIKFKFHEDLKITRPALLKEFLFSPRGLNLKPLMLTEKTQEPSTAIDHLLMFGDSPEAKQFVGLLKQYSSAQKTLSTYVVGFLKHLRPDGRFHGTYLLHRGDYGGDEAGTVTGRSSCKEPALQTVPKKTKWAKRIRRVFVAPEGYSLLSLDYSQGELRLAACAANEQTMLKAYASNADLHSVTAAKLAGYEFDEFMLLPKEVREPFRTSAKPSNFGLLYGMGANGYQVYANTTYGLSLTLEDANKHRTAFFDLYSGLVPWHKECKSMAKRWGQVRSPLGRVRHLPLINSSDRMAASAAERQAVNSPIQSTLSDMMQLAMVHVDRMYGEEDIHMFLMCHDSISLYVPLGTEMLWAKRIKDVMENLPLKRDFNWTPQLVFVADAECSVADADGIHSLASMKGLKDL